MLKIHDVEYRDSVVSWLHYRGIVLETSSRTKLETRKQQLNQQTTPSHLSFLPLHLSSSAPIFELQPTQSLSSLKCCAF